MIIINICYDKIALIASSQPESPGLMHGTKGSSDNLMWQYCFPESQNTVSTSALLTRKFLRIRKVLARLICNGSLKGPYLSAQCKPYPGKMDGFRLFASGKF